MSAYARWLAACYGTTGLLVDAMATAAMLGPRVAARLAGLRRN